VSIFKAHCVRVAHPVIIRAPKIMSFSKRVIEAERANRESRLWLLALISAVASAISALAAWAAILRK
jgi:hypothetical protein